MRRRLGRPVYILILVAVWCLVNTYYVLSPSSASPRDDTIGVVSKDAPKEESRNPAPPAATPSTGIPSTGIPKTGTPAVVPPPYIIFQQKNLFKDTLVVVNWNSDRYEHNVAAWNEVYGTYFPNVVKYGPSPWDNAAPHQRHEIHVCPPVLAGKNSYVSLWQAMKDYPNYSGYLWVNFDVYLDLYELSRLDFTRIWYRPGAIGSIDAEVPNPAWKWDNGDATRVPCLNTMRQLEPWQRLSLTRWWNMHRASKYKDETILCLISPADALYLPGSKRDVALDLFGKFHANNVFCEVAIPMTLILSTLHPSPSTDLGFTEDPIQDWSTYYNFAPNATDVLSPHAVRQSWLGVAGWHMFHMAHPISFKTYTVASWVKLVRVGIDRGMTLSRGESFKVVDESGRQMGVIKPKSQKR